MASHQPPPRPKLGPTDPKSLNYDLRVRRIWPEKASRRLTYHRRETTKGMALCTELRTGDHPLHKNIYFILLFVLGALGMRTRVSRQVLEADVGAVDVAVDLGRPDIRMAQEFLHHTQVGTSLHQMGGE